MEKKIYVPQKNIFTSLYAPVRECFKNVSAEKLTDKSGPHLNIKVSSSVVKWRKSVIEEKLVKGVKR